MTTRDPLRHTPQCWRTICHRAEHASSVLILRLIAYIDTATLPFKRRAHGFMILRLDPFLPRQAIDSGSQHVVIGHLNRLVRHACEGVQLVRPSLPTR